MTSTWVMMETNTWNPENLRKEKQLNNLTSFVTLDKEVANALTSVSSRAQCRYYWPSFCPQRVFSCLLDKDSPLCAWAQEGNSKLAVSLRDSQFIEDQVSVIKCASCMIQVWNRQKVKKVREGHNCVVRAGKLPGGGDISVSHKRDE